MIIHIYGLGFVGLTTALALANKNLKIYGYDTDFEKVKSLNKKILPFYEEKLDKVLSRNLNKNFFVNKKKVNQNIDLNFVCVGTQDSKKSDFAQTSLLRKCFTNIINEENKYKKKIIVIRSSTPPLTTEKILLPILKKSKKKNIEIVYFPEFLAEGKAWKDFHKTQRIVIGLQNLNSKSFFNKLFKKFKFKIAFTNIRTAEFVKYLTNCLLSTLISFSNEFRDIAERISDIEIKKAFKILQTDQRWFSRDNNFNYYTFPGCGFGGSCLPKDLRSIIDTSKKYGGYNPKILSQVQNYNVNIFSNIVNNIAKEIKNKKTKIGILGLSFKPNTDDVRGSPTAKIIPLLIRKGYKNLVAHDPISIETFSKNYKSLKINYEQNINTIISECEKLIIVTSWDVYKKKIVGKIKDKIIDLRYLI